MMVYGAGALVTGPFAGRLADPLGHARILKASLWSSGSLLLLLPFAASRPALFVLVFLWAALTQAFWPSAMALLAGLAAPGAAQGRVCPAPALGEPGHGRGPGPGRRHRAPQLHLGVLDGRPHHPRPAPRC